MPSLIKLIRLCKDVGIVPDILFPPKYNSLSFVDKLPIELGTTPSNCYSFLKTLQSSNPLLSYSDLDVVVQDLVAIQN